MVSIRCKMIVKNELEKLGIHHRTVELGVIETIEKLSAEKLKELDSALRKSGLELMDNKKSILIENIKTAILELVHYSEEPLAINLSLFLTKKLNYDYTYMANLFSEVKGTTIEQFYIHHKIERVKELIVYDELNLTEIAYLMHYSSISHLSSQFKKVTGLTPSHFKQLKDKRRNTLEDV